MLLLAMAAGYFILARVSLFLSFQTSNATPVWPPSGYAFAIILIFGYRIAPAIFIGAFAANFVVFQLNDAASLPTALWVSALISIGNMGEAVTGYYLLRKIRPGIRDNNYFGKTDHLFIFSLSAVLMSLVSSSIGTTSIFLGGIIPTSDYSIAWVTWWLGDVSGILIISPLILLWRQFLLPNKTVNLQQKSRVSRIETIALFTCIALVSGVVFNNWFQELVVFNWAFWIIPFVVWAAVRFDQHESITAVFLCSVISISGTLNGGGPFAPLNTSPVTLNESLLILQAFVCIIVITTLILNASVSERKQTEMKLRDIGNELEQRVLLRTNQLKSAAEKIELVNRRLTEAQRLAHIGNWEWDIASNRLIWSDELFRIFHLNPQNFEATYESYLNCIHRDDRETLHQAVQNAFKIHQPYSIYHRVLRPDGTVRILHGRGEVILNQQLEPVSMVGTAQDVTEIKQAEQEIKQLADNLMRYNKQLEQTNKELESFTFVASHDLQEPLRKIRTFLHLINEKDSDTLSHTSKDYIKRIIHAAERMQLLINDLLLYSRTTGSPQHFQKTDLNEVVNNVIQELTHVIEEKKAQIQIFNLPKLSIIPFQFHQLFANMISNSLKFSREGVPPHIVITGKKEMNPGSNAQGNRIPGNYYSITVSDNGIGFEPQYSDKIFDLFQRLHSRTEYSGTGIGLSICKKIVENHGGFIEAHGKQGEGATFIFYIPVDKDGSFNVSG